VFSLTGIKDVWAIVESAHNSLTSVYGEPIVEAPLFYLSPRFNDPNACVYGGDYELSIPDPCPNDDKYLISIYATDNSKLPKLVSYKTSIENPVQKTKVLIIASDPGLFPTSEAQQKLLDQVNRAEEILEGKGLSKSYGDILTISGEDINSLDDLSNAILSHFPPDKDLTTLFIYMIGHSVLNPNNAPCFYINPNVILTPQQFCAHIPMDPNERLLVLMDAPYAQQFLSAVYPNTLPRNWAGIASTNKWRLFFPLEGRLFPCFSNFFFSMVLSGATVSKAYRMTENAVSLTLQKPELLLPEEVKDYQTINRHLNYYLGTSAIQGEDYSLFTECSAQFDTQNGEYHLSLTPRPDANITHAWAILTSPALSLLQDSMIVDLDPNGLLYTADEESGIRYYKAFFFVEGSLDGETNPQTTWSDWKEVHIAQQTAIEIREDKYEPDDDPNSIILDPNHKIIVNASPQIHTFYSKETKVCNDIDWIYFNAQKGHIYEIYAWDPNNNYFIQLALYDPNIRPLCEEGVCLISNNKLVFSCNQSGYYLFEMRLASSCPPEGVEFIVLVLDRMTKGYTSFLLKLIDPLKMGMVKKWKIEDIYLTPTNFLFIYPDIYYYKFSDLESGFFITTEVYRDANCNEPLADTSVELQANFLNQVTINLSNIFDPNIIHDPNDDYPYYEIIEEKTSDLKLQGYSWKGCGFKPSGDMDSDFPPDKDYDGDKLHNFYETFACESHPHYPTFLLTLHKGINLYYFFKIDEFSSIIPSDPNQVFSFYYSENGQWEKKHDGIKSNAFNAIYTSHEGMLSLDLKDPNNPFVFCLKGLMDPNSFPQQQDPNEYLNQYEVWSRFIQVHESADTNFPTLKWDPNKIAREIGSAALMIDDPNGLVLLVDDMSKTSSYQPKKEDAVNYLDYSDSNSIPAALFSYAIGHVPIEIIIDLPADWSMISLPVIPDSKVASHLFPDANVIYRYSKGEGYVRVKEGEDLKERKGYWIQSDTNRSCSLIGQPIPLNPLPVQENGWDMIGGCTSPVKASKTSVDNGNIEVIYGFVPGYGYKRLRASDCLEPGKGYWIKVSGI
jgi:hypothetical protein